MPRARDDVVEAIVALMRAVGYLTAVSSIHIHSYFPANEKSDGVFPLMQQASARRGRGRHARRLIGDSPNDASLFAQIPLSVAWPTCSSLAKLPPPAFVCGDEIGAGFVEFTKPADRVAGPATVPRSRR